ncbi:unnamed protein product [Protopolystoma xenopodis]|uniref:Uncharacterized protein n=1 Tax=Protopolystoma xenopodis TaxID=117903 RepID=A0A448X8V8_9PLAT|nr:unnamed protein product [Protopolystoma xenopodis]
MASGVANLIAASGGGLEGLRNLMSALDNGGKCLDQVRAAEVFSSLLGAMGGREEGLRNLIQASGNGAEGIRVLLEAVGGAGSDQSKLVNLLAVLDKGEGVGNNIWLFVIFWIFFVLKRTFYKQI